MRNTAIIMLIGTAMVFGAATASKAANCSAYTYTFSNGTTADATQVNSNFNTIMNCANNNLAPISAPSLTGNGTISGYFRAGSNSAPVNATAGDLTAARLSVGNQSLTANGPDTISYSSGSLTALSGSDALVAVAASISPSSDSAANYRALYMSGTYNTSNNFTGSGINSPTAAWFENRITNAGNILQVNGFTSTGIWAPTAAATLGTVTEANAGYFQPIASFSNALTSVVTKAVGVHVINSANTGTGPLTVTGQVGIEIDGLSAGTNNTSLLIGQTTTPTGNFGVYNASTNVSYFAGSLGLGTAAPAVKLAVTGDIRVGTSGTNGCVQNFAGTALTGTCSSDARLKVILGSVTNVLDGLDRLNLVHFKWNDTAVSIYHNRATATNTGFIAQSVEKVFPELVSTDTHGYKQINYTDLQLYGLEAIKELKAENDNKAREIVALQSQLGELRKEVAFIKRSIDLSSTKQRSASTRPQTSRCIKASNCLAGVQHS